MNAHTNKPCTQRPKNFVETTNITLRANTCNAHTRHKLPNRAILRSCGHGACTRSKHLLLGMHAPAQLYSHRNSCSCVRVHAKHQSQKNKPRQHANTNGNQSSTCMLKPMHTHACAHLRICCAHFCERSWSLQASTLQASCRALHKMCAHEREPPSSKLTNMRVPPKSTFPNEFWYMSKLYFELERKVMSSKPAIFPTAKPA